VNKLFDLTGKLVLVTRATYGLSIKYVKSLINQGTNIVITARKLYKLKQVKKEIKNIEDKCFMVSCDVSKTNKNISMTTKVKEYYENVIIVNNAGIGKLFSINTKKCEELLSIINIKLTLFTILHGKLVKL